MSGLLRHGIRVTLQRIDVGDASARYDVALHSGTGPLGHGRLVVEANGDATFLTPLPADTPEATTRFVLALARQCAGAWRSAAMWPRTLRRWRGGGADASEE